MDQRASREDGRTRSARPNHMAQGQRPRRRSSAQRPANPYEGVDGAPRQRQRQPQQRQPQQRQRHPQQRQGQPQQRQGHSQQRPPQQRQQQRQRPPQQRQRQTQHGHPQAAGRPPQRRTSAPVRRRRRLPVIPIAIGAVALCVVGFFLFQILTTTHVTVNGQELKMRAGDKIQKLLDDEVVKPNPGRLLAVDKSVIDETGGEVCTATINGEAASVDSEIPNNATITIEDGGDTTEEADEKEEAIPHGTADDDRSFNNYFNGSLHLLTDGEDGTKVVRTGKVSGKTVEEVTKPAVDSGYQVYTAKPSDKVIALTFDDGPWPETTSQILDILEENNAKATFFTIGNQIADHADDVKRAHEMGCQICTHSWDHADGSGQGVNLCYMSASEQREEIEKGIQAIEDAIGEKTDPIMRAPGGNFYDDIIDNVWDLLDAEIGWDLDTEDWSRPGSDAIEQVILSAQPGQVILMHDGGGEREQTVEALKSALPKLAADGYSFITINEMLAYGVPGASGTTSSDGTASEGLERTTGSSDSTATDASDDTTASDDAANEETSSDETAAA